MVSDLSELTFCIPSCPRNASTPTSVVALLAADSQLRRLWPTLVAALSDATFELQQHMFCGKICGLSAEPSVELVGTSQVL